MTHITKYLPIIAIILSVTSIVYTYGKNRPSNSFGSAVLTTASSDTLETFRTNVNSSLLSLQSDKVGTTTAFTWSALQSFYAGASTTALSANSFQVGQTATTTITANGKISIASTTPVGTLNIEQGTESFSAWIGNQGSSTPSFIVNGVNGNGRVGIATSTTSFGQLNVGGSGATSTISGGRFCSFFEDEAGRKIWIRLAVSGNVVFSTLTAPCNI